MSAVFETQPGGNADDLDDRLSFFKKLQAVTNKIHSTNDVDEIMLDLSQDICDLFNADRLTIYALSADKTAIVSKIKTGLKSFKDLKLPISDQSIAGYVALSREVVNVHDVYDEAELRLHSPGLHFLQGVDTRTGYRTKQMLAAPLVDARSDELLGAVQLINNRSGGPFGATAEEGIKEFCATLAIAFSQRQKSQPVVRSKFDNLVSEAILSAPSWSWRRARRGAAVSTCKTC
jgi:GAF domain-containing protein